MTPSVLLSWQQFCFRIILRSIDILNPTLFTSNELVKRRRAIWTLHAFQVGQKWRYLVHNRERVWGRKSYHGNVIMAPLMGVILFLKWLTLLVPSLSSITTKCPEIFLILLFIYVPKRFVTSSIFEQKLEYFWNERRYS